MKNRPIRRKLFLDCLLILTVAVLSSCANGEATPYVPFSTPTIFVPPNITTPTVPTSTFTSIPPTPTIAQTFSPTVLPLPTLDASEAQDYLIQLIQNPGNCRLPCFMGFTPGVTSWREVEDFGFHLGLNKAETTEKYADFGLGFTFEDYISLELRLNLNSNLVYKVRFTAITGLEVTKYQQLFASLMSEYSPGEILARYGKPSGGYFSISTVNAENPAGKIGEGYLMWLVYNLQGFMIRYDGLAKVQNGNIHICPHLGENDITWMALYLQEPVELSTYGLESTVDDFAGWLPKPVSLEKATGLSIDQFMGLGRGELRCFDTPYSSW